MWNGPFGAFETPPFEAATFAIAKTVGFLTREGKLKAIAGGGDTVAALNQAGVAGQFTYVSAAGGAFLEWMEGKALPGVEGGHGCAPTASEDYVPSITTSIDESSAWATPQRRQEGLRSRIRAKALKALGDWVEGDLDEMRNRLP